MSELKFESFGLSAEMNQALSTMGYETPSPIQAEAIPVFLEGKDMIGQAQTGTGKTASFAIPIIEKVDLARREIQAVVLCPTRELALQVTQEFRKLAKFKTGLSIVCVYGGESIDKQKRALDNKPQILVGTPGRMLDFLWRGTFHLNSAKTVVLDEADEMLNMGFRDDIEKIFDFVPTPRQMIFFSATMPKAILELTRQYQVEPAHIKIQPKPAEVSQISQAFIEVSQKGKLQAISKLIDQHDLKLALIFCNTKRHVDMLAQHLQMEGYAAEGLHGGKAQHQRERILARFRKGATKILVATDVAARGIDVSDLEAVVNYDLPEDTESYTHRIGRTGRAGKSGLAFSLVAGHQVQQLRILQRTHNNAIVRTVLPGMMAPVAKPSANKSNKPSAKPAAKPQFANKPGASNANGNNDERQQPKKSARPFRRRRKRPSNAVKKTVNKTG